MPTRKANAVWKGNLKEGNGSLRTETGVLDAKYSYTSRFKDGEGTNPEELIGAAHAGCFSMAFALMLEEEGYTPEKISTSAEVTIEKADDGFVISHILLDTEANVPDITESTFHDIAKKAKGGCPVSKALHGTKISLQAKLM